ncbi:MAG: ArsR/SmtB family transcription factor [Devosia sp.]
MSIDDAEDRVFKALGNRVRRRMLDSLKSKPATTGTLCEAFPELDRCTVMQHLQVLEDADLIIVQRQGRERWNHLNAIPIQELHERWIGSYAEHAADRLLQLKRRLDG